MVVVGRSLSPLRESLELPTPSLRMYCNFLFNFDTVHAFSFQLRYPCTRVACYHCRVCLPMCLLLSRGVRTSRWSSTTWTSTRTPIHRSGRELHLARWPPRALLGALAPALAPAPASTAECRRTRRRTSSRRSSRSSVSRRAVSKLLSPAPVRTLSPSLSLSLSLSHFRFSPHYVNLSVSPVFCGYSYTW